MVRIKHRYILLNILYPDPKTSNVRLTSTPSDSTPYTFHFNQPTPDRFDAKLLLKLIRDGVAELFGDYGSGKVAGSLQIKYLSSATSTAIVRVARDHYRLVWAALSFVTRLPRPVEQACVIRVMRVSGTIRKAEEEAIRRARISIRRAKASSSGASAAPVTTLLGGMPASGDEQHADEDTSMMDGIEDVGDDEDDLDDG
jgi:ribonuclease P/MRP protein subunit POP5